MNEQEKNWALFAHLSALIGFIIPFGNIVGPLIIWQIKKDEMPFASKAALEALNFQITMSILYLVCAALIVVVVGAVLLPILAIYSFVVMIIAAIKSSNGEDYQYKLNFRLIK